MENDSPNVRLAEPLSTVDRSSTEPQTAWRWHLRALLRRLGLRLSRKFRLLLPMLPPENFAKLKENVQAYGHVRLPLLKWDGLLIDGHHRCIVVAQILAAGVVVPDPKVESRDFASRADARLHAIALQEGQRPGWGAEAKNAALIRIFTEERELIDRIKTESKASQGKRGIKDAVKGGTLGRVAQIVGCSRAHAAKVDAITSHPVGRKILEKVTKEQPDRKGKKTPPIARAFREFNAFKRNEAAQKAATMELAPIPQGSLLDSIQHCDVLDGLRRIKAEGLRVNLTVTSVPYPVKAVNYPNYTYDGDYQKWLNWMGEVFGLVYEVSGDSDRLAVNFDLTSVPKEDTDDPDSEMRRKVDVDLYNVLVKLGWVYRDEICWQKQNAVSNRPMVGSFASASSPRFQRTWEPILIFHKGSRIKPQGVSDITTDEFSKWTIGHWDIKPETEGKNFHRCPFPVEIPKRLIKLLSYVGETVLDPFMGYGTTGVAAKMFKRRYLGIDNDEQSVKNATTRIAGTACAVEASK